MAAQPKTNKATAAATMYPNSAKASSPPLLHLPTKMGQGDRKHEKAPTAAYLEYDGNKNTLTPSMRLAAISDRPCGHYRREETGEPRFDIRVPPAPKLESANRVDPQARRRR